MVPGKCGTNGHSIHVNQMRAFVLRALHLPECQTSVSIVSGSTARKVDNSTLQTSIPTIIPILDQEAGTLLQ